jgi:hypothetical protein
LTFSVISQADTDDVTVEGGSIYELLATSSSFSIDGQPVAAFLHQMLWSDPQGAGDIVFQDPDLASGFPPTNNLSFTQLFVGLETYKFATSLGPVSIFNSSPNIFGAFLDIPTDQGLLTITAVSDATFTATVATPEPSSLAMSIVGVFALLAFNARRTVSRLSQTRRDN